MGATKEYIGRTMLRYIILFTLIGFSWFGHAETKLRVELDPTLQKPAPECELLLDSHFNFKVTRVGEHNVYLLDGEGDIRRDITAELTRQLMPKVKRSEDVLKRGFVDFYFDGYTTSRANQYFANETAFMLRDSVTPELYETLKNYIVPRYKAGFSIVPHPEIARYNRGLLVRIYVTTDGRNSTWHRDGTFSLRGDERWIAKRAWTFGQSFDQPNTEFKQIPGLKADFGTSVIFDGATEEHRGYQMAGRVVILGTYYQQ